MGVVGCLDLFKSRHNTLVRLSLKYGSVIESNMYHILATSTVCVCARALMKGIVPINACTAVNSKEKRKWQDKDFAGQTWTID